MKINHSSGVGLSTNLSEINVTPLVDVMLVLLIIFMVTAPMMAPKPSKIKIDLPSAHTNDKIGKKNIIIAIDNENRIVMEYYVKIGNKDEYVAKDTNEYNLERDLNSFFEKRNFAKKIVFLKGDKNIKYGFLIHIMDLLKKAGVETIGMIVKKEQVKEGR